MVCYPEIFSRSSALEIATGKICSQFLTCSHFLDSNLFFTMLRFWTEPWHYGWLSTGFKVKIKRLRFTVRIIKRFWNVHIAAHFNFENERKLVLATFKYVEKEISLANLLGTRSLFIAGGGRILGGNACILGEQKEGSVVTENPKWGIAENFGRIHRGGHSNLLGNWRLSRGIAKVIKCY